MIVDTMGKRQGNGKMEENANSLKSIGTWLRGEEKETDGMLSVLSGQNLEQRITTKASKAFLEPELFGNGFFVFLNDLDGHTR